MIKIPFNKSLLLLFPLLIIFIGCGKDDNNPEENIKNIDVDIYVAGFIANQSIVNKAAFWQNNQTNLLTGYETSTAANDIFIAEGNSYVVGYLNRDNSGAVNPAKAIIWQNGIPKELLSPLGNATSANRVFVSQGNVYVVGYTANNSKIYATLWVNGNVSHLTDGTNNAQLKSVFVSGKDVYVAGYESILIEGKLITVAKYWKNGVAVALNSGTKESVAEDIFVSGNDVYVVGNEENDKDKAVLWKNDLAINLATTGTRSYANAVAVEDGNVYVVGYEYITEKPIARLWKNGKLQHLETGNSLNSKAYDVQVIDGNVFVSGYVRDSGSQRIHATVWENGKSVAYTNGVISSVGRGLSVKLK